MNKSKQCPSKMLSGVWPTVEQELFLRSALLGRDSGNKAWNEIRETIDIRKMDISSRRLMPLIYKNLGFSDPSGTFNTEIKEIYKITHTKNKILMNTAFWVIKSIKRADINVILLKGAALALSHYKDYGVRSMEDVDILVERKSASRVMDILKANGFRPLSKTSDENREKYIYLRNSQHFLNDANVIIDLHWNVFSECCYEGADAEFWAGAISIKSGDVETLVLNPTDQLLHILAHGVKWNPVPPIRWVTDAVTVIKSSGSSIDWVRLAAQAEKRRLVLPVKNALFYLNAKFNIDVPGQILSKLARVEISGLEYIEYSVRINSAHFTNWMVLALLRYLVYFWNKDDRNIASKIMDIPRYVQYECALDSPWKLPVAAFSTALNGFKIAFKR